MNVQILGIPFNPTTQEKTLSQVKDYISRGSDQLFIATPNPEMVLESLKNEDLRTVLQKKNRSQHS